MTKKKPANIHIRTSDELKANAEKAASAEIRSLNCWIEILIEKELKRTGFM